MSETRTARETRRREVVRVVVGYLLWVSSAIMIGIGTGSALVGWGVFAAIWAVALLAKP